MKMQNKDEFTKVDIKNHSCYYDDDILPLIEIDFGDILLDKKPYKDISIYNI